ncbi:VWA domain-containing protein [Tautonia marina]|uniref:VWA domain-containing protein n=1 Tax=Tautonia marina TaxID=2653855 RepID=UPI001260F864|nr:VWA domain-containing protein [Tautonia marina]
MILIRVGVLIIVLGGVPAISLGQPAALDPRIDTATANGVEYLRRQQSRAGHWDYRLAHDHRLGMTALCGLAMMENGVSSEDEAIVRASEVVRELAISSDQTYDLALAILFLSRLQGTNRGELDGLIQRLARRLEGGHNGGFWSYRVPLGTSYEAGSTGPGGTRPPGDSGGFLGGPGDLSNTQFALLGIWTGGRHEYNSDAALEALDDHLRSTVNPDGGWGYRPGIASAPAMTCAGLMGLAIAASRPSLAERLTSLARGEALVADPVFAKALEKVSADARFIGSSTDVYYLWSLERVCVALGLSDLNGLDWYAIGAESLLNRQLPNGGWPPGSWQSLPETCLALLFLRKSNLAFELDRVLRLPGPKRENPEEIESQIVQAAETTGDDDIRVVVRQVDESGFPEITLDFEVTRPDGAALVDADQDDFRVTEYDQPVEILRFEAPTSREVMETTVVLVVDQSRSMEEENRIGALKEAVRTFLSVMPIGSRVAVIAFSDEIRVICPFTTDVRRVQASVDELQPMGGTRYYDAVVEALELIASQSGRRAVLAMTDGEDTFSRTADLDATILAARRLGLPVHTLGLGSEEEIASDDLRRLAAETRGQYLPARNADQLRAIYEELATRLGQMYRLVYQTERPLPDGTLRPVAVYFRSATVGAQTEVFIRGMVVPASGWPRLFLGLIGVLVGLALLPGLMRRRSAARLRVNR